MSGNFKNYIRVPLPDNNERHVPGILKLLHETPHCLGKSDRIAACVPNIWESLCPGHLLNEKVLQETNR